MQDGRIVMGSMPKSALHHPQVVERPHPGRRGTPSRWDLASDEIFTKKPPFIFFTGHEDFKLTDQEVENLQKYLQLGGCIWGGQFAAGGAFALRPGVSARDEAHPARPGQSPGKRCPPTHPIFYPDVFSRDQGRAAGHELAPGAGVRAQALRRGGGDLHGQRLRRHVAGGHQRARGLRHAPQRARAATWQSITCSSTIGNRTFAGWTRRA